MDSDRFQLIKELFHAAADLDPEERSAYLDRACRADPELRTRIEAMLAADPKADAVLDSLVAKEMPSRQAGNRLIDTQVGQYHITDVIASGGMGTVYEAMQEKPRRRVALKVLKAGTSSPALPAVMN